MMSNSNYSIGLQRLTPVYTAYCGLHNLVLSTRRQILTHSSGDFDDIMLTNVLHFFYIFVCTCTCNDMRSVMLQINEYDDGRDETETETRHWYVSRPRR